MTLLFRLRGLALQAGCALLAMSGVHASRQDDSLQTVLDGVSGSAARASALLELSKEREQIRPGESLIHARNALSFARRTNDRLLIHSTLEQVRDLEHRYGAGDEFLRAALDAMELSEAIADAHLMAEDLQWLAVAYEKLGELDRSVEMSRKAVYLLSTTGDSSAIGRGMLQLLNALVKAGRFKEAITQSDEALKLFIDHNDSSSQAGIWVRSAEAQLEQGDVGDALPGLIRAERVLAGSAAQNEHLRALADLARAYEMLGDHQRARMHADAAVNLAFRLRARGSMPELLGWSSRIHESLGNLRLALLDERWRQALEDSLMDERVAERMAGMQELYQLDHKERELHDIRTRYEASEEMIAEGRAHGRWWLGVFGLMLGLLGWSTWALLSRRRVMRRIRLKNHVIRQQSAQIHANNLELERRNLRLAEALVSEEEKGALLKEIHHRVKNNLQIVNALLRLQSENVPDGPLAQMLRDAQGRVRAMAMVHEHLYRLGDLSRIDMRAHLQALAQAVIEGHGLDGRMHVEVITQLDRAPVDTMLPLSLLVNELLTNAAKHAFPGERKGSVRLVINRARNGQCELFYSDDGVGIPNDVAGGDHFGMSLIRTFVQQLDGTLRMVHGEGTTMVIAFDPEPARIRAAS